MKTYLKKVKESKNVYCWSKDMKKCHYLHMLHHNNLKRVDCKCKGNPNKPVFIKADPVKIVEWYERKVNRISKSLNDYLARNQ